MKQQGHLNVNLLKNKMEALAELIKKNMDTSLVLETKSDETFRNQQFNISTCKTLPRERNQHGEGLLKS